MFTLFALMMSMLITDMGLTAPDSMVADVSASAPDEDSGGRFRIRFRNGSNFETAENVPGGFYNDGFDVHLFATVGGVPDPTATIHYTTSGSTSTSGSVSSAQTGAVNANPTAGSVFVRSISGQNMGHNALTRYDGGIRPYTWNSTIREVGGIPTGIPSFTGGTGRIAVSLTAVRMAFTISAVATRVVGGQTVYSEPITRTFVRGPRGTDWADNDFLVFSLYSDARGIFDFEEGIFNCGRDFYDFMDAAQAYTGTRSYAQAITARNSHTSQGQFPPTLPGNNTRRGRGTDWTNTGGERMAHMEIFDPNQPLGEDEIVRQRVGIRVKGGWSRGTFVNEQKTLEIYCRNGYGDRDNVLWPIFGEQHTSEGNLMHRYRRFRLRMGGNDREQTYVRDEFANTIARAATDELTPTHRPGVVFLNGSYYGLVWIRSPRTEDQWRRYYYAQGGEVESSRFHFIGSCEQGRVGCARPGCDRALPRAQQPGGAWSGYASVRVCSARPGQTGNCGRNDCEDFQSTPNAPCTWDACRGIQGPGSWAEVRSLVLGGTIATPLPTSGSSQPMTTLTNSRLANPANAADWARFQELVCLDDLMQFYALNIFGANNDWPGNNCEMWRYFPTEAERNDPNINHQLRDGRWRFKIHDMEFAYGLWNNGEPPSATSATANTIHAVINRTGEGVNIPGAGAHHFNAGSRTFMMTALMQREDMRIKLANALMDIMSASHTPTFANAVYNDMRAQIRTEHSFLLSNGFVSATARNGTNSAGPGWPSELGQVEVGQDASMSVTNFMNGRGAAMREAIAAPYRVGNPTTATGLGISGSGTATRLTITGDGGSAVLNTRPIGVQSGLVHSADPRNTREASVNYFGSGNIIPVTASPWPGYEIDRFTVGGTAVPAAQIRNDHGRQFIMVAPGAQVTVSFKVADDATFVIDQVQARGQNWIRISNNTGRTINTRGMYLSDNYESDETSERRRPHDMRWRMPALILRPGTTVTIPMRSNDEDSLKWAQTNFGIGFGERLRLADRNRNIIQHIEVSLMNQAQIQERSPDGFWTINEGPCRDCGRCGCMQCFGANQGSCNRNTCARCWCSAPACNRLLVDCICGPGPDRPLVEGDINGIVVTINGNNVEVRATEVPGHGQPFVFRVQIRLPGEFRMNGSSQPGGVTWTVQGDILTIVGTGRVEWGNGLGSMHGVWL
jgi:hypothetical protein